MTARSTDEAAMAAAQAEAAEAEAAEAQAVAAAAAARAKAARLRQQADQQTAESRAKAEEEAKAKQAAEAEPPETPEADEAPEPLPFVDTTPAGRAGRRIGWRSVAAAVGVIVLIALLTLSGLMIWSHDKATKRQELQEKYAAGARQGVINLMSLNFNNGQADLQRVLDTTTGSFHDDFEKSQKDFLTVMQDSKVITSTSVDATAVETMNEDSASVLITATSQVANNASQQPTPRSWRLSVTVQQDNGQIKMSKVEFVP